jgi:hypothetical protein
MSTSCDVRWIISLIASSYALGIVVWLLTYDRLIPRKPWWNNLQPFVARRHLESFRAWEKRWCKAERAYSEAQRAMMNCPEAEYRQISERGFVVSLPANHSLSLRSLSARYPDGPSYEELANIGVLVPSQARSLRLIRGGKS